MSTVPPVARAYEALRPTISARLLDLRATLDPSLGRLDEAAARAQLDAVLEHLGNFIATGDHGQHRAFLQTFLAIRAAEGQSPAAVLAMLVAIGDTATQIAHESATSASAVPTSAPEGAALTLLLTRVTASTARAVNDLIAEQLEARAQRRGELTARQEPER